NIIAASTPEAIRGHPCPRAAHEQRVSLVQALDKRQRGARLAICDTQKEYRRSSRPLKDDESAASCLAPACLGIHPPAQSPIRRRYTPRFRQDRILPSA